MKLFALGSAQNRPATIGRSLTSSLRVCGMALASGALLLSATTASAAAAGLETKTVGDSVTIAGKQLTIKEMHMLKVVKDEYSLAHQFEDFTSSELAEFRAKYNLDEAVQDGTDEFDKQVRLLDWAHRRVKKFGRPSIKASDPNTILVAVDAGMTFFCSHYANVMAGAAQALGWPARVVALRRPNNLGKGPTGHTVLELWSNQYGKWVMFDPTFAVYMEKDGVPLNAWELRQQWFYQEGGKAMDLVLFASRDKHATAELPIKIAEHAGFGTLALDANTLNAYAFMGYLPRATVFSGLNYAGMFITQDKLGEGTTWHIRKNPTEPATEPYFALNQADLTLTPVSATAIEVRIESMTPSFKTFQTRVDGQPWQRSGDIFSWALHDGTNTLEVRSVNLLDVPGHVSRVELEVN